MPTTNRKAHFSMHRSTIPRAKAICAGCLALCEVPCLRPQDRGGRCVGVERRPANAPDINDPALSPKKVRQTADFQGSRRKSVVNAGQAFALVGVAFSRIPRRRGNIRLICRRSNPRCRNSVACKLLTCSNAETPLFAWGFDCLSVSVSACRLRTSRGLAAD